MKFRVKPFDPTGTSHSPGDLVQVPGGGWRVRSHRGEWLPVAAPPDRSLVGPPGRDGRDGERGDDGKDGANGVDGEGFRFRGVWKRGIYQRNDVVTRSGSSWVCTVPSTNLRPGVTKAWAVMAQAGADGADGKDGRNGMSQSVIRFRNQIVAGPRLSAIFAEDAQLGDAVYLMADGRAGLAQANAEPNTLAIGLARAATRAGWPGEIATSGLVSGLSGLTPGSVYYLDPNVAGGITATYPTGVGRYVVIMGSAVSETEFNLAIHWANYIGA